MNRTILWVCGFVLAIAAGAVPAAAVQGSDTVVLVNSQSDSYEGYLHYVKPYIDHFGVPYSVVDIATSPVPADIGDRAEIIVGHRRLDVDGAYLDAGEQALITAAVNAGTGLVNFDNDLWTATNTPRYAFVNSVFGFGYVADTSGSGVNFPNPTAHYITLRHSSGIGTGGMTLPGVTLPGAVTAVATTGTQPFLAVTTYGAGHAVQWGSYEWMSASVKGPMYGLDDLVWRSIVWAARKPFVMQGLPPFLTMRVDDESGNFEWIHIANEFGIKPWAGLFISNIDDTEAADLSALVHAGNATASIHAYDGSFFYFNHGSGNYPDATVAQNFVTGTAWHAARNIPIAKYVLPHYYEFGSNVFQGLSDWGVEFVGTQMDPGNGYGAPWVMNGPFRLYETGGSSGGAPQYYADYMTIPGHPEFDGRFFNCVTEIRDDAGYEWYPNLGDVAGTIGRGTRQTIRALDAMALPTLFTHGYYVGGSWGSSAPANWRAILSGIMTNIASYNPINVTMDDACRYVRAVHDSDISAATFDSGTNRITVNLSGTADVATKFYVFTGEGTGIIQALVDVPVFSGSTVVQYTLPGPLDHIVVTPNPATVVAGATQQFSGTGYDADDNPIPNLQFVWSVANGGGTIDASGRFTAGVTPGSYGNTVVASYGAVSGAATVVVTEPVLDHFDFDAIGTPKYRNAPFTVTITARDAAGNRALGYVGSATLSDTTGTVAPSSIGPFSAGIWQGPVVISTEASNVTLTVTGAGVTGTSNAFNVTAMPQGAASIWPASPVPGTPWNNDVNPLEVGVKFRAAIDGYITALRFYKGAGNTGTHVGHLWDSAGNLLSTVTFTNETASGWQQAALPAWVAIQADRTYVASYHTGTGYAADRPYFTTGVDSPPLRALRDGEDGGNGVYKYDSECGGVLPCYPTQTYQSSNYWVDVVFLTPDSTPPTVASTSPADTATGVGVFSSVSVTFSETMDPATITASAFRLKELGGTYDVPATVSYAGLTATLDPVGALSYGKTYEARVAGTVTDVASNALGADHVWTFTTAAQPECPCTIWPGTTVPTTPVNPDVNAIEVGVKFRSALTGYVTGLRFYKGAANTGVHVGHLWDAAGNLLAEAAFTGETAAGWQEVTLSQRVPIAADTTYIASYHTTTGYAINRPYFLSSGFDSPPLRALQDGEDGGNGVYKYDSTCATPPCAPDLTYQSTNYWVDVVFNLPDNTPPTVTGTSPANGAAGVDISANVTAAFSELMNAGTITSATFRLRETGAGSDVPATVSYTGLTATLDPTAALAPGKVYQVTVSGTVSDIFGNSLGADYTWSFTTAAITTLTDTSSADFGSALASTCSLVAHTGDGEVTLVPAMATEFDGTALPAGWVSYDWKAGGTGTATVSGGKLTVNGARANPDPATNNYGPGRSLEFVATYATATLYQQGGFGGGLNAPTTPGTEIYNTGPMTTFTTEANGSNLYARAWTAAVGGTNNVSTSPVGSVGTPHRYRMVWNASSVEYYIDGNSVYTWNVAVTGNMRPAFSEYYAAGGGLSVDWMRMSPYASPCALESRVFDAGRAVDWLNVAATGSRPTGTAYSFETRSGNTSDPNDGTWSGWAAVSGTTIASPNARYLQYRATLATSDDRVTAELQRVDLTFDQCAAEVCNGLDDDCDGTVDNGNPGGGAACSTGQQGLCSAGTMTCTAGALACVRNVEPSPEVCNGLDDDCDGVVDGGNPGGGVACSTGLPGICSAGTTSCSGGAILCSQNAQPSPEACDGLDNDCNGVTDDGRAALTIQTGIQSTPGAAITVPITLGSVAGMGVYSSDLDVAFDPVVLEATSVALGPGPAGTGCAIESVIEPPRGSQAKGT